MRQTSGAVLLALLALAAASAPPGPARLVISDVTVVDTTGGPLQPHRDVVVDGDRIVAVRPAVAPPKGATVVEGRGRFLIPGLWDMHAHSFPPGDVLPDVLLQLQVANGVTGVRDMGATSITQPVLFRRAAEAGVVLAPHLVVAGRIIEGPVPRPSPTMKTVATPEEGRRFVDEEADAGVDFVKVYNTLSRDTYFAIADEAKKRGLPFAGHVPNALTVREAAEAGQASEEHFWGVLLACSSREEELTAEERAENAKTPGMLIRGHLAITRAAIDSFDPQKAEALWRTFAEHDTYLVPTLVTLVGFGQERADIPGIEYMRPEIRNVPIPGSRMTPQMKAAGRLNYAETLKLIAQAHRAGVPFMAGSDTIVPGFVLHEELEQFVRAGFTPLEALQTATLVPARFLHREATDGSVVPGKTADLVLLGGDPTADIRNTRKIEAVMLRGRLLDRAALDTMLAAIHNAVQPVD